MRVHHSGRVHHGRIRAQALRAQAWVAQAESSPVRIIDLFVRCQSSPKRSGVGTGERMTAENEGLASAKVPVELRYQYSTVP